MASVIKHHSIKHGKKIKIIKNEKTRVRSICRKGCNWTIFGSSMQGESTIQVKTYFPEHICPKSFVNKNISSKWLGKDMLIGLDLIRKSH